MPSNKKTLPPIERLRNALAYNPTTGSLKWNYRDDVPKEWNTKHAGKNAFTAVNPNGYKKGAYLGVQILAHRLVWALHYGKWPDQQIDHINGDKTDNRIINLRDVSQSQNQKNAKKGQRNTSGCVGVYWSNASESWYAQIRQNGKTKHLGFFNDIESARKARLTAQKSNGYHENHGR